MCTSPDVTILCHCYCHSLCRFILRRSVNVKAGMRHPKSACDISILWFICCRSHPIPYTKWKFSNRFSPQQHSTTHTKSSTTVLCFTVWNMLLTRIELNLAFLYIKAMRLCSTIYLQEIFIGWIRWWLNFAWPAISNEQKFIFNCSWLLTGIQQLVLPSFLDMS